MATTQQPHVGLLQKFGLPSVSRNEYMEAADRQRREAIMSAPGRYGEAPTTDERNYRRLGVAIADRFRRDSAEGVELSENQERSFEIVENAQRRYNQLREDSGELWSNMTAEDKGLTYRRFLADSAAEAGDADLATSLNDEYVEALNQTIKQREELRKLGIDSDLKVEDLIQRRHDNQGKRDYGIPVAAYPINSNNPNTAVRAMEMPDGSIEYTDPETGRKRIAAPGEWSPTRPQRPPEPSAGRSGGVDPGRSMTTHQLGELRKDIVNMTSQLRTGMEMYNLMADMAAEYGSVDFLSTAGGVVSYTTRLVDNVAAMTRTARNLHIPFLNSQGEEVGRINAGNEAGIAQFTRSRHARGWMRDLDSDFAESTHLRNTFRTAEAWKASVVRLAYARARAREPGARQLSDVDIQQARAELGAMTTDPGSFQQIMLSGLGGDMDKLQQSIDLVPDRDKELYFGEKGMQEYQKLRSEFLDAFEGGGSFGTAGAPGPGLLRPDRPGENGRGVIQRPEAPQGTTFGEPGTGGAPPGMRPLYYNGQFQGYVPE